jgi:starch phosphorylase
LTPRFSTNRSVSEYTDQHYLPAAAAYRERAAEQGKAGVALVEWQHELAQKWPALRFGEMQIETTGEQQVVEVQLYLDGLNPDAVQVELYANGMHGEAALRVVMLRVRQLVGASNGYAYRATLPADRPASDFTARLIPLRDGVAVPLEAAQILWQR